MAVSPWPSVASKALTALPLGWIRKASPCCTNISPSAFSASSKTCKSWIRGTGPPVAMLIVPLALGSMVQLAPRISVSSDLAATSTVTPCGLTVYPVPSTCTPGATVC